MLQRLGIVALQAATHPEGVLVQLDPLAIDVPEHHRAKTAVAERHRVIPLSGWLSIPERCISVGRKRNGGNTARNRHQDDDTEKSHTYEKKSLRDLVHFGGR